MVQRNRKLFTSTLSFDNAAKLEKLSQNSGKPKAHVLDEAVSDLYRKEEEVMELNHKAVVITCATNKGGAGKTTSTAAIADILARRGNRVLLIDADPQGNLSKRFGYAPNKLVDNYFGSLIKDRMEENADHAPIDTFINHAADYSRIDVIASDIRLDGVYSYMNADNIKGTYIIRNIVNELRKLDQYDFILIDTRPSLNNEVGSALIASDYVIIPVEPTEDAVLGADATIKFMVYCRNANPDLKLLGIFMVKVYDRNKSYREVAPFVRDSWQDEVFKTLIPRSQDADNAGNESKPVTSMFSNKKLSKRYEQLVEEMVGRIEKGVEVHA